MTPPTISAAGAPGGLRSPTADDSAHPSTATRRRRAYIISALLVFLLTRFIVLAFPHLDTDVRLYYSFVERASQGAVPYRDIAIPYPPVAWWMMTAPQTTMWPLYRDRFRRLMMACDLAAFVLFGLIVRRRRPSAVMWACVTYAIATTLFKDILYDRLDAGILLLLMIWAYTWLKDEQSTLGAWRLAAFLALGVGVGYKLVPGVMFPFAALAEIRRGHRWTGVLTAAAVFLLGATLPFFIQSLSSGLATLGSVRFQLARGIEVESIYAVAAWVLSAFGTPLSVAVRPDAVEIVSPATPALLASATLLSIGAAGAWGVRAWRLGSRYTHHVSYLYAMLGLVTFTLFAKVLSPQYFIWLIPVLLLCAAEVCSGRQFLGFCAGLVALAALTVLVFPVGTRGLFGLNPRVWTILTLRNVLFVSLMASASRAVFRRERDPDAALDAAATG